MTIKFTQPSDPYRVLRDGVEVSTHPTRDAAIEAAINAELETPAAVIEMMHSEVVRFEMVEPPPPPPPPPQPEEEPTPPPLPPPPTTGNGLLYDIAATMQPGEWRRVPTQLPPGKATFKAFQTVSTPTVGSADGMGWTDRLVEHNGSLMLPLMRDTFGKALAIMSPAGVWRRIEAPVGWSATKSERRPFNRWFKESGFAHFAPAAAKTAMGYTLRVPLDNPDAPFERYGIAIGDDQMDTVGNFSMCEGFGRHWAYTPGGKLRSWAEGELAWREHAAHIPQAERNSSYAGTVIFNPIRQEVISIGGQFFGDTPNRSYRVLRVASPTSDAEIFDATFEDGSFVADITAADCRFFYHTVSGEYLMLYQNGIMYYSVDARVWRVYEDLNLIRPWGRYEKYCPWTQLGDTDVLVMVSHIEGVWLHRLRAIDSTTVPVPAPEPEPEPEPPPPPPQPTPPPEPTPPLSDFSATVLGQFAATVQPGQCLEFPSPTLNTADSSGARPFSPPPNSGGVPVLDWASMMDLDPTTLRFYTSGGRPRDLPSCQKMIWYDAKIDKWESVSNWSLKGGGHIYRQTAVAPGPRKVLQGGFGWKTWNIDGNTYGGTIPSPSSNLGSSTAAWQEPFCNVWHPGMGSQGALIMANIANSRIVRLDWETQTWGAVVPKRDFWTDSHLVGHFQPLANAVILGSSSPTAPLGLSVINADKSHRITAPAPAFISCRGGENSPFVPHPTRNASIAFCRVTGRVWSYEWDADTWVDRGPMPAPFLLFNTMAGVIGDVVFLVARNSGSTVQAFVYKPDF